MKNVIRAISFATILTFALAACGGGSTPTPPPTAQVPAATSAPTGQPPATDATPIPATSNSCGNPYWPIKKGIKWEYSSTGSPSGPYDFDLKVKEVQADGFTIAANFKKSPSPQNWLCKPEGLIPSTLVANNVTSILGFRKFQGVTLSNVAGVYLPASINPGQTWTLDFDFAGTQQDNGVSTPVTGHANFAFTAGNNENVTVAAGSYNALAITLVAKITFVVTTASGSDQTRIDSTYTYWYAPDVGWVKATGSGKLGGQDYFETIELSRYTSK